MTLRMRPLRSIVIVLVASASVALTSPAQALDASGEVSGTWTATLSPVFVRADCHISPGRSLVIEPGVQCLMAPGASLVVDGSLSALGSAARPIQFARLDAASGPWRSVRVGFSGQAILSACVFRGGGYASPSEVNGALRIDGGQMSLMSSEVSDSVSSGVLVNGGSLSTASSWFDHNGGTQPIDAGIHIIAGSVYMGVGASGNGITNSIFGIYNEDIIPVDASGTWWGAATGPQHVSNVLGLGVSVSDDVLYSDYITVNPRPSAGDLDRDGLVTVRDAAILLKVAGGMAAADAFTMQVGDVVRTGAIDLKDAQALALAAAGTLALP